MKHSLLLILSIFLLFSLSSCIKKKEVKPDEKDGTFVMIGQIVSRPNNPPPFSFTIILGIKEWVALSSRYTRMIGKGVTDSLGNFQIICDYYPKPTFYIHEYTLSPTNVIHASNKDITNLFTHPSKPNDTVYVDPIHLFK